VSESEGEEKGKRDKRKKESVSTLYACDEGNTFNSDNGFVKLYCHMFKTLEPLASEEACAIKSPMNRERQFKSGGRRAMYYETELETKLLLLLLLVPSPLVASEE
jgi:hypothetical protein